MMRAMLKPDFSAASLPGDNPGANARAWKLYRQVSERTGELARKGGKGEAQAFLRQIQDSGQFQQDQIIQLKMVPFRVLAELENSRKHRPYWMTCAKSIRTITVYRLMWRERF